MKKGQIVEGIVREIQFPNKGIVEIENEERTVVVKNVLEGQRVSLLINKIRKGKAEGRLIEVLEKSPDETEAACPHFAECGGCTYQNLPYEKQLQLKADQVKKLLYPVCQDYQFLGIKASPQTQGYRNKMEFSFGDAYKDGPLSLGMHKRGSFYDIVTVNECQIIEPDFRKILSEVLHFYQEQNSKYLHKLSHQGYLRHLLVRRAVKTKEILIDLVTSSQVQYCAVSEGEPCGDEELEKDQLRKLTLRLAGLELDGRIVGILHTVNDSLADVIQNDRTDILYGVDHFFEEIIGLKFKISPFSFFQTNSLGAEVLYETAREFVGETKDQTIFDLYSGTGTIAQMLSPVAKKVIGIEIVEEAVEAAKQNAKENGLANCEFIAGDVLKAIDLVEDKPDFIVLDPPRDGINPKALEKIIRFDVDRMVYISCKPTSLARDLEILTARGYQVEKVCCVDMFPATVHVETVVLLSKGDIDSKKVHVEMDLEGVDMSGFQKGATYEAIKGRVEVQTGLKVSSLYIAQVKQKYGIIERENYNKSKTEDTKQPKCPPEKEKAIEDALRYFNMI